MISTLQNTCYDVFAVTLTVATPIIIVPYVVISPFRRTPIVAGAITCYSGIKTAYYAVLFFMCIKQHARTSIPKETYLSADFKFKKTELSSLKRQLVICELQKKKDESFEFTKKAAISMIPVIGLTYVIYSWIFSKREEWQPKDAWNDIAALKYHINLLEKA